MIADWWKAHRLELLVECVFFMLLGVVCLVGLIISARRKRP